MKIEKGIKSYVDQLTEEEAKKQLELLLLNYNKIGKENYSRYDCMEYYGAFYRDIVIRDVL
ncbi:hypothetical protein NQ185_19695 [Lederbergia panacisoli]|nr:hypothetical protein [Lederbergia panacisoli]